MVMRSEYNVSQSLGVTSTIDASRTPRRQLLPTFNMINVFTRKEGKHDMHEVNDFPLILLWLMLSLHQGLLHRMALWLDGEPVCLALYCPFFLKLQPLQGFLDFGVASTECCPCMDAGVIAWSNTSASSDGNFGRAGDLLLVFRTKADKQFHRVCVPSLDLR